MGALISGIHHVALKCNGTAEYKKTLDFYQNTLELEPVRSWGEGDTAGAMLSTGDGLLEIFASGAIRHFALRTDRVDDCIAAVRKAGYAITVEPKDIVIAANPAFPARIAFCIGPVGEEIEFFQEKTQ